MKLVEVVFALLLTAATAQAGALTDHSNYTACQANVPGCTDLAISYTLSGTIPTELAQLVALNSLAFRFTSIHGAIPSELGTLTALTKLDEGCELLSTRDLSFNQGLSGTIPSELAQLTALEFLNLRLTDRVGTIPLGLYALTKLKALDLSLNQLSGSISSELGQLTALETIILQSNMIGGPIPTEVAKLTKLQWLTISNLLLTGALPSELGLLTTLSGMFVGHTFLTGTIPTVLGELTALTYLDLGHNFLAGTLPTVLGKLTALTTLYLWNNYLSGTLPSELAQLTALSDLFVQNNTLCGALPAEVAERFQYGVLQADIDAYGMLPVCPSPPPPSPPAPPSPPTSGRAERNAAYVAALKGKARTVLKAIAVVAGTAEGLSSTVVLDNFERACAASLGARCIVSGVDAAPNQQVIVSFVVFQVDAEYVGPIGVYVKMADGGVSAAFKAAVESATGVRVEQGPTVTSLKVHAGAPPKGRATKLLRKFGN